MAHPDGIAGHAFLVTAGASGIGRACAEEIVAAGGRVGIADIDAEGARAVAAALGSNAIAITTDVRRRDQLESAIAETERAFGPLRGAVAAAGLSHHAPAHEATLDGWNTVIDVSLTGCFLTCQLAGRRLIANGGGAIVTIASVDALGAHAGRVSYNAAKFAMIGMVRTLALEWGRHGIRVNTVAPNVTDTPGVRRFVPAEQIRNVVVDRTPLARIGAPADVGRTVAFLLSDAAAYVSGAVVPVDGGLTAGYITRWHGGDYASKRMLANGEYAAPEPAP